MALALLGSIGISTATAQPGTADPGFNPNAGSWLDTTALQADGKVLLGGIFGAVGGVTRNNLARVNPDGTLDRGFNPNPDHNVRSVIVQPDGKILIAGFFSMVQGVPRNSLARLNPDGALDTGFNVSLSGGVVVSMAVQPDGRILLVGSFSNVGGLTRGNIARLNADGTVDTGFSPATNSTVFTVAVQADGKVLVGGAFTTVDGQVHNHVARLNPDGTLDTAFNPNSGNAVHSIVVQPDERILMGGDFRTLNGVTRNRIARLNSDGTLDAGFNPNASEWITSMVLQADGRIVVGGIFTTMGGAPRHRVARLNPDGTLDMGFNPDASYFVNSVALQGDGKIVLGGLFTTVAGVGRNYIARLENDAATQSLSVPEPSRVEWLRGGATPESTAATFELTTDGGATYAPLGAGTRISGGWELTGLTLPASGHIRGRTVATGGYQNGSSSVIETLASFGGATSGPEISISGNGIGIASGSSTPTPVDGTDFGGANIVGDTVTRTFTVRNLGTAALTLASVTVSGANAADFIVSVQPYSSLAPGGTTTFDVTFNPSATGLRTATLELVNDDGDESPYSFDIRGAGVVSNNADLAALSMAANPLDDSVGTLAPSFDALTLSYTASVASSYASLVVTPTAASPHSSIQARVNSGPYQSVNSGGSSGALPLNVGSNLVELVVTAQDEVTVRTYTITIARGTPAPGHVDPSFDANLFGFGLPGTIHSTAVQLNGKILVGGSFQYFAGVHRQCIARFNADGTTDPSFPFSDPNDSVRSIAIQPDGKILIGGQFTYVGGVPRNRIARLNSDGSLDMGFNPDVNDWVFATAPQADGKIVIGGYFTAVGGVPRNYIARLNADGTLDSGFDPNADGPVQSAAVATDGTILMGGTFFTVGGLEHQGVARLNVDGIPDPSFQVAASGAVDNLAIQSDGRILLGGLFLVVNGTLRQNLARLNTDGTLDPNFDPEVNHGIRAMALQTDGRILIGGYFTSVGGTERPYFARLSADGTLDTSFNPEVDRDAHSISMQSDGRILVGGAGVSFRRIVRLLNEPATQSLSVPDSSRIKWLRGGSSPETNQVTFELSVDGGVVYTPLGAGTRISGGWELAGLSLPPAGQIRARARTVGGQNTGSSSLIETEAAFSGTPVAEISVRGNGTGILNGDGTPDQIDHTDFGTALIPGAAITRTFTVANLGTAALTLGAVGVVGPGAGDFSVTALPDSLVDGGSSTALQITFAPTSVGLRSATVTLANNDADENPFAFSIQGTGVLNTPEITVTGNGAGIVDGDGSPSVADNTDFGGINISAQSLVRTFVVRNNGVAPLALGSVAVSGVDASDFTVATQPFSPVGPGSLTTFQVAFDPSTVGLRTAIVTLANNDLDENPFDFAVQGTGVISSNVNLSGLTLSRGTLTPVFAPGTTSYAAALGFNSSSIRVTPTSADGYAAIQVRVNGGAYQGVASGSQSGALALNVGPNAVEVLVTAQGGTTTKTYNVNVVRAVSAAGDVKPDFNPDVDGLVRSIAPQKDGKIIIGGEFTSVGGIERNHIARLNADGTLDLSFNPGAGSAVRSAAVQSDGAILIGGDFFTVAGASRSRVARLNLDGTVDPAFDPSVNGMVHGMMLQPDGKIVIGGLFGTVGGLTHNSVARLNVDGTPDPAFVAGANNTVYGMAQQGDGRILIVGAFTFVNGVPRNRMARLNPDGTLDGSFNPNLNFGAFCTAVQPDGKILVGGVFSSVGGTARNNVARLNPDGTLDTTFNPNPGFWVRSLTLQADGKIVLGGSFTSVGGIPRNYVARLNPDGSLDPAFNPSAQASIWSTAIEADGKILIAGDFTSVDGVSRNHLARLDNDPATQSLTATGARIEWLRGGSSPETHQVTFELSVDGGAVYSPLGPGARINGGWELTGLSLPPAGQIRAGASTAGGENNGSSGLVEAVTAFTLAPPIPGITISDATLIEGDSGVSSAVFTVSLSAPSADTVTVSALTSNLSATAGDDYTAAGPTTVTFAPTVTTQTFSVPVAGDTALESDETLLVTLSSPVNATIADDTGLGTITNDDGVPPSRVFVSSSGSDTNVCMTHTTPCRNLGAAIGQLAIDGEVIVLTSGEYDTAPILIGKGVKITSPSGTVAFIRQPITVNAPGGRVALRGLTLKGNAASSGITLTAADALSIEDTTMDGWGVGLDIANAAPSTVAITKTVFQGNLTGARDAGPASNRVSMTGSRFEGNGTGLSAAGGHHTVSECSFVANTIALSVSSGVAEVSQTQLWINGTGLAVLSGGTARIGRSHVFGNTTGLSTAAGGTLASFGSNVIRGNGTNIDGTVTTIPEQ